MNFIFRFRSFVFVLVFILSNSLSKAQITAGNTLFGAAVIHNVYLNFTQPDYWDSLKNNYITDVYMKCKLTIDGTVYDTVGVKFKGNSSYNNPGKKKPFKVGIDEFVSGQKHDGIKKFNLNNGFKDPTMMREKLALDFANQMGAASPRCTYAKVYLNNVYWGLYTLVEEVDKTFLDGRFSDKKGNLFKGDPSGDLKWLGSLPTSYYTKYELKTNTTNNNWTDLVHAIDNINNTPAANFYDSLESVMNTSSVIKSWAVCSVFSNLDSYLGSGHNYFIYDDSLTLKFNYILWDVNESFGNFNMGMSVSQMENLSMFFISNPQSNRPLYQKMLANTTYKSRLVYEICNMMNYYTNAKLDTKIDSIKNAINNDVIADTNKYFPYTDFVNNISADIFVPTNPGNPNIAGLKPFIQNRNTFLTAECASNGCFVGIKELKNEFLFTVFPNPATDNSITIRSPENIKTIELFNALGEKILEIRSVNKTEFILPFNGLSSGVYLLKLNGSSVKRIVLSAK